MSSDHDSNQAAFRRLERSIKSAYPFGEFVAIHDGEIVAHASTFPELLQSLAARPIDPQEALVVQAGAQYPEYAVIC